MVYVERGENEPRITEAGNLPLRGPILCGMLCLLLATTIHQGNKVL